VDERASPEEKIHALMDRPPAGARRPAPVVVSAREEAARQLEEIQRRVESSRRAGIDLQLAEIEERFGLTAADKDLLLAALTAEVGEGRARPSVGFALAALFPSVDSQEGGRARLSPDAPLRRYAIVSTGSDAGSI